MTNYKQQIQEINEKMIDGFFTSKDHQRKVIDLIKATYDLIKFPNDEIVDKYFWDQVKLGNFKKMQKLFHINYWGNTKHTNQEAFGGRVYVKQIFGKNFGEWNFYTDNWTLEQPIQHKDGGKTYWTREPRFHKPENLNHATINYNVCMDLHNVKEKHREFFTIMGLDVDAIFHLVELRKQAKEYPIVRPESKQAKIIRNVTNKIKQQIEKGEHEIKLFRGNLDIHTSSQYCSNWNGTRWIRTYWYYNSKLTPFETIIEIVKKALEDGLVTIEDYWVKTLVGEV